MWGELSSEWGELSSECGASCLGASFLWGELSWGELSLGRVVRNPSLTIPLVLPALVYWVSYQLNQSYTKIFLTCLQL